MPDLPLSRERIEEMRRSTNGKPKPNAFGGRLTELRRLLATALRAHELLAENERMRNDELLVCPECGNTEFVDAECMTGWPCSADCQGKRDAGPVMMLPTNAVLHLRADNARLRQQCEAGKAQGRALRDALEEAIHMCKGVRLFCHETIDGWERALLAKEPAP